MKHPILFLLVTCCLFSVSCEKLENSVPEPEPYIPADVLTEDAYFVQFSAGGQQYRWESQVNGVANFVDKQSLGSCGIVNSTYTHTSSFAHVADTNFVKAFSFYTSVCLADTGASALDSVFYRSSFPVEILYTDSIHSFGFAFIDNDTVLWQSNLGPNGVGAQATHSFNVDSVQMSFDGTAARIVSANFSSWMYNSNGDSIEITNGKLFAKVLAY